MDDENTLKEPHMSSIEAMLIDVNSLTKSLRKNPHPILIKQSWQRKALKRILSTGLETYDCEDYLPSSGFKLEIIQTGSDSFKFRCIGEFDPIKEGKEDDWKSKTSVELSKSHSQSFLKCLRLCQIYLKAIDARKDSDGKCLVPSILIDTMESLDDTIQGRLGKAPHNEAIRIIKSNYDKLRTLLMNRINIFIKDLMEIASQKSELEDLTSLSGRAYLKFEKKYIEWNSDVKTISTNYLNIAPCSEVGDHIKSALSSALYRLISIPKDGQISDESHTVNSYTFPHPKLMLDKNITNPYDSILDLCITIEPHNSDIDDKQRQHLAVIKEICKKNLTLNMMLSPDKNPRVLNESLHKLMIDNSLNDVIENTLKKELPGVYDAIESDEYPEALRDTADLRGNLNSLNERIKRLELSIEGFLTARDMEFEHGDKKKKLQALREQVLVTRAQNSPSDVRKMLDELKLSLESFEESLESVSARAVTQSSSVLWVGLGQGGSQILRECLLYCMDNINDARASSLLSALGLDSKDLIKKMKDRNGKDLEKKMKAESDLKELCDNSLRILAVNIGSDIDRLVLPDQPGYFLWGESYNNPAGSKVVRVTKNTLRLDASMDGAGGSTGLGRSFGFARSQEIDKIIGEIGKKNNSKAPSHVIITHSYAGGSGSGMTLPILQQIRRSFDADTVIWVMSVGEGDSEDRDQAVYNTPFIISDILQAHYDGIHSPVEPVLPGQWKVFSSNLQRNFNDLSDQLTEILELVGADKSEVKLPIKTFLDKLPQNVEIEKRKAQLQKLRSELEGHSKFKTQPLTNKDSDYSSIRDLIEILPSGDSVDETRSFNDWCEKFEDEGSRPALNFWQSWVECASDPLGLYVSGRENVKQTQADGKSEDERRKDFMPSLSEKDLDKVMKKLERDHELLTKKDGDSPSDHDIKKYVLPAGLEPLYDLLKDGWTAVQEDESKSEYIGKLKSIFRSYKSTLRVYNNSRRELTSQIRALTSSSNDERVKNIIISNAHLERGVKASSVKVAENSYTVFNSVIFDFILNIIGSQMPSKGSYMTTSAEAFDEQDLIQHTKSPLAVGLFDHRDSLSLGEKSLAESEENDVVGNLVLRLFADPNIWDGMPNPLYCTEEIGGIKYIQNSLFGTKGLFLLQNNPYDTTDAISEPEPLSQLVRDIEERWISDQDLLGLSKTKRNNIEKENGFTGLHLGNIVRWLSAIDIEILPEMISPNFKRMSDPTGRRRDVISDISQRLTTWNEYSPESQPYDNSLSMNSYGVDTFIEESGNINTTILLKVLPKIGIWNDHMLRSVPPAYLNTYLPPLLLKEGLASFAGKDHKIAERLSGYSVWSNNNQLYGGFTSKDSKNMRIFNMALEKIDLQLVSWKEKTNEGEKSFPRLRLHPRMQRYLSVLRTLSSSKDDCYLPARSTAGLLPRYLMADNVNESVGNYSTPSFKQAGEILNWYRYIGLLPDENRFEWPSFLRILLLADTDYSNLERRLKNLSRIMDLNLDDYRSEITNILSEKYSTSGIGTYTIPSETWDQMTVLQNRIILSIPLAEKLLETKPNSWRDGEVGIEYWIELVEKAGLTGEGSPVNYEYSDSESVEETILQFQYVLNSTSITADDETSDFPEPVHHVRRFTYDLMTYMREALLQSIYQSSNSNYERVHYEMTGFSDIISGVPGGLLCLVHDKGKKMDKGEIQGTIRKNVHHSIGYLGTNKEFSTSSRFGPNATSTLVMMQAPVNEAARQFSLAMERLKGTSKFHFLNKTKLHPYVFLYNLLWLPTNIERWISADNESYIRRFQMPLEIINSHYLDPQIIIASTIAVNKEQAFRTGGVGLPADDVRDMENCKKGSDFRNITKLIGIMALRHQHNSDDILWGGILSEAEFTELKRRNGRAGSILSNACLKPYSNDSELADDDDDDDFWDDFDEENAPDDDDIETLEDRGKAWFTAYKNWLDYSIPKPTAEESEDIDLENLLKDD